MYIYFFRFRYYKTECPKIVSPHVHIKKSTTYIKISCGIGMWIVAMSRTKESTKRKTKNKKIYIECIEKMSAGKC